MAGSFYREGDKGGTEAKRAGESQQRKTRDEGGREMRNPEEVKGAGKGGGRKRVLQS